MFNLFKNLSARAAKSRAITYNNNERSRQLKHALDDIEKSSRHGGFTAFVYLDACEDGKLTPVSKFVVDELGKLGYEGELGELSTSRRLFVVRWENA